jgi:hypothetical protein
VVVGRHFPFVDLLALELTPSAFACISFNSIGGQMTDHATNLHMRGHENDSYAAVQDIPIMASPLYKMPNPVRHLPLSLNWSMYTANQLFLHQVSLGNQLAIIPENVNNLVGYRNLFFFWRVCPYAHFR